MMKTIFHRIFTTTALCLAAVACTESQPTEPASDSTDEQAYLCDGYTKVSLDATERKKLSKVLAPFLNAPNEREITVKHLQYRWPDDGTRAWLYAGGTDCEYKTIGAIKAEDFRELAKANCYFSNETDTQDYFMTLLLKAGDYSVRVKMSPVSYDNISVKSKNSSAYVYSEYFHRILMQVIDNYYSLDSRS